MKSWVRYIFVFAFILGLVFADGGSGSGGGGDDHSGSGGGDGDRRGEDGWGNDNRDSARSIGVKVNNDKIEIRAVRSEDGTRDIDAIGFEFATNPLPFWVVSYFSKDADTVALTRSRWALWKLVEYSESGAEQGFQPGVDAIVQQYPLWTQKWTDLAITKTQVNDATVYSFCTEARRRNRDDGEDTLPFTFRLCNFVTDRNADINGTKASANALKWSLEIDNYPYSTNITHLALKVGFDSLSDIKNTSDGTTDQSKNKQDALEISSAGDITTAISWVTTVDLVGTSCPATANVTRSTIYTGSVTGDTDRDAPRGDSSQWTRDVRISYFSFLTDCQPSKIVWDPEFGVVTPTASHASMASVSIMMVLLSIICAMAL